MQKVSLRVPIKEDGTFDLQAQRALAMEFVAVQDAVRAASTSLETISELKPRADLPQGAKDLGLQLDQEAFNKLSDIWRAETGMFSMLQQKINHPAYQRIIATGMPALPFIFRDLEKHHDHWLLALKAITGKDVAKPRSKMKEAIAAWLAWGREKGYL
jgi:hypothetical protein